MTLTTKEDKHFLDYSREDILKCLKNANLTVVKDGTPIEKVNTKTLSKYLNEAIEAGDACELEDIEE